MRVEEMVGRRVHDRRKELGMTQEEFGRKLEPLLGKPWSRQMVSMAEKGSRAWAATDLIAVAAVLETRSVLLLTPPVDVTEVEMPTGATVPTRDMIAFGAAPGLLLEVYETLSLIRRWLKVSSRNTGEALGTVNGLADKVAQETMKAAGIISYAEGGE